MAKKRTGKSLSFINSVLKSEIAKIKKSQEDSSVSGLEQRVSSLESELRESITIAMSMIAVNKELITRVQESKDTASPDSDTDSSSRKDTSSGLLTKIYNFFVKDAEDDKKKFQLQKDFEEEREMESKKRRPRKSTARRSDPKKPSSNPILSLLGFIGGGIKNIFGFLTGGLFNLISKGISGITSFLTNLPGIGSLFSFAGWLVKIGWKASSGVLGLFGSALTSIVTGIIGTSGKIIWGLLRPVVMGVITGVMGALGGLLSGLLSAIAPKAILKALMARLHPAAFIASLGLSAYEAYSGIKSMGTGAIYGEEAEGKQKELDDLREWVDNPHSKYVKEHPGKDTKDDLTAFGIGTKEDEQKFRAEKFKQYLEKSAEYKEYLEKRYEKLSKTLSDYGYKPITKTVQEPDGFWNSRLQELQQMGYLKDFKADMKTKTVLGFQDPQGKFLEFASTGDGPNLNNKGADWDIVDAVSMGSAAKFQEGVIEPIDNYFNQKSSEGASTTTDSPASTATPVATTPETQSTASPSVSVPSPSSNTTTPTAPSEKSESDSASVTPATTSIAPIQQESRINSPIPSLSDMDSVDQDSVQVVNMPKQSSVSTTDTDEMPAIPSVRNTNPVIYRTVAQNDRALIRH